MSTKEEFSVMKYLKENKWSTGVQDAMIDFIARTIEGYDMCENDLIKLLLACSPPPQS